MTDRLDDLLRLDRGELSSSEEAEVRRRLASDPDAEEWLTWLTALRRFGESAALSDDLEGPEPDPMDVAALAEGTLSPERARAVRDELAQCPDGYEMLAVALDEARIGQDVRPAQRPTQRPATSGGQWWRWRWVAAAAAIVVAVLLVRGSGGGDPGTPDLSALVDRTPLPVPTMRSDAATRGLEAYENGDFTAAARELETAAADEPEDGLVWLYLGSARRLAGDDAAAVDALERARTVGVDSVASEATWQLAHAHLALGNADDARACLEALGESPRADEARGLLGRF